LQVAPLRDAPTTNCCLEMPLEYWSLESNYSAFDVYLPDKRLLSESHRDGVNPITVRKILWENTRQFPEFQLIADDGDSLLAERQILSDLLFWSWVPIVSERARRLLVSMGCGEDSFIACKISTNPDEKFCLHLPQESYDVVDVERSRFLMTIPGDPPIPFRILSLALKATPNQGLPACFRATIPGHNQVFGELIVNNDLKKVWEEQELEGAQFRRL